MLEFEFVNAHIRASLISVFIMLLYWLKELMEYLLRVVFGVDRRLMYVPVAQNTRTELPLLGSTRVFQRGELFYFVYHSTVSISLALLCYLMALYTPAPTPTGFSISLFGTGTQ